MCTKWCILRPMRRATVTLSDDLEREVAAFLTSQEPSPSLNALIDVALTRYLDQRKLEGLQLRPASAPFRPTPAKVGSGRSDVAERHDDYLAEDP
jgi:hypothetical protein